MGKEVGMVRVAFNFTTRGAQVILECGVYEVGRGSDILAFLVPAAKKAHAFDAVCGDLGAALEADAPSSDKAARKAQATPAGAP